MAKVFPAPLVASVSGSIGMVTFAQTRFGLIVQSKPIPPYPGSTAQQLSVARFSQSMKALALLHYQLSSFVKQQATLHAENPQSQWVAAFYRYLKSGVWDYPRARDESLAVKFTSFTLDPPFFNFHTNLDTPTGEYWGRWLMFKDGAILPAHAGKSSIGLFTWDVGPALEGATPPFTFVLFPFLNAETEQYGFSSATEVI